MDLQKLIHEAKPGSTVRIPGGVHAVNLVVDKPLTLLADGAAILEGRGRGSVVRVEADGLVRLEGLTLRGGAAPEAGGGVCFMGRALELLGCVITDSKAPLHGGGGVYLNGERATLVRCRIERNTGRQGAGVLVDEVTHLNVRDCLVAQNVGLQGGGMRVKEAARASFVGCTFADNKAVGEAAQGSWLHVGGTSTRRPEVEVVNCIVAGREKDPVAALWNGSDFPGVVSLRHSLLPESMRGVEGVGLRFGTPGFKFSGREPYVLAPHSTALEAGDSTVHGQADRDLLGRSRVRSGRVDLGAFAFYG